MLPSSTHAWLATRLLSCPARYLGRRLLCGVNRYVACLQALTNWMHEEDIVQRILRTNLHQRQYMQEVSVQ